MDKEKQKIKLKNDEIFKKEMLSILKDINRNLNEINRYLNRMDDKYIRRR